MTLWPVIVRELRAQSRQPATYWLRIAAAGTVLGMFVFFLLRGRAGGLLAGVSPGMGRGNPFSGFGTVLFGQLNAVIFLCNAFLAPLLTADCISRERREGTLGLLFLTDLSAAGIVAGKAFVHSLRAVMLFCAMLPVLAVPVLVGGVAAKDCVMALLIDSIVLVLGLSAGIVASSVSRDWIRSLIMAELISATLVLTFMCVHVASLEYHAIWTKRQFSSFQSPIALIFPLFSFHTNLGTWGWSGRWGAPWDNIWSMGLSTTRYWIEIVALIGVCALLTLLFAVLLAALRVERSWREEPVSRRIAKAKAALTRPRFATATLRRRLSRSLERNPVGWLQHYSWSGRITKWGWLGLLIVAESLAVTDVRNFPDVQPLFVLVLVAGLAFTASASFRAERESGALELLLVCPLTVSQLMWGRLRGVWAQYLPSFALLIVCLAFGAEIESYNGTRETAWFYAIMISVFITLPVIGLFFSLHTANFIAAWLWTMALGIGLPILAADQPRLILSFFGTANADAVVFCLQWVVAEIFWLLLYDRLTRRRFLIHA